MRRLQRVTVSRMVTVLLTAAAPDPDIAVTVTVDVPAGVPVSAG
jgi:hypothetical protein